MTIGQLLKKTPSRLKSDTARLDTQVLLARATRKSRSWVLAHPEVNLTQAQEKKLEAMVARVAAGEPLPYVLGEWEFNGLTFKLSPDVLIPRPETELLVETALRWLKLNPGRRWMVDVGTGCGCIAASLATKLTDLEVIATDISAAAIEVARKNARRLGVAERVNFSCCDLLPATHDQYDLIVANLPYIPTETLRGLPIYQREPSLALDGGANGLDLFRQLLSQAPDRLRRGGLMLLEIEATQGPAVLSLAYDAFAEAEIRLHKDLGGKDRLLEVQTFEQ